MGYEENEALGLTQQLVRIESTNVGTYEGEISRFIKEWLRAHTGAEILRAEYEPGRFNVVATLRGAVRHPNLIYIAHMDTVPLGDGWTVDPLGGEIRDGKLFGRGACDMKSGMAAAMLAFRGIENECRRTGVVPKTDFVFVASGDEEDGMKGADRVVDLGIADSESLVLDTEPTGALNPDAGEYRDGSPLYILMAHKGKAWFEITTTGVSAHGAMPQTGVNAITAMAEIILEIRDRLAKCPVDPVMGASTACFGTIQGGTNTNIVADKCSLAIDIRISPPLAVDDVYRLVADAIAAGTSRVPGSKGEYRVLSKRPFVAENRDSRLMDIVKASCKKVLGRDAVSFFSPCYTDSGVIGGSTGNADCMSIGPYGSPLHQPDEYVDCRSVGDVRRVLDDVARSLLL
jgi:succinyl-diaminopimelate desuccinylase